jgi:hypothetical protein
MSRKLAVVFLAMLVLVGAMGLKTVVMAHGDGSLIMANGASPVPILPPSKNGASPVPILPPKTGSVSVSVTPN